MTPATRKTTVVLVTLLSLVLATWLDVLTGVQVSVFFLYIIPVVVATWFLGLGGGIWLSLLATVAHRWADWPVTGAVMGWWAVLERSLSSFVLLGFIAVSFHTFKRGRKIDRERIEQLEALVRLCPVCNRVHRTGGQWQSLEECLVERPVLPHAQRLCPDCMVALPPGEDGL